MSRPVSKRTIHPKLLKPMMRKRQSLSLVVSVTCCVIVLLDGLCVYQITEASGDDDVSEFAAKRISKELTSPWVELGKLKQFYLSGNDSSRKQLLDFGQGFADYDAAPSYLTQLLYQSASGPSNETKLNNQYTRACGHPNLVKALVKYYTMIKSFRYLNNEESQVLVTIGAYEALYVSIMAFVNEGDDVIIVEPAFDAYEPIVSLAGGKAVPVKLKYSKELGQVDILANNNTFKVGEEMSSKGFFLDEKELESKLSNKTKLFILNTPNNPIGKVFSRRELEMISKFAIKYNFLVLADEVYEQLVYDKDYIFSTGYFGQGSSIATLPNMWERTITVGSAGKTFSVTGWKLGWAVGHSSLIKAMQLMHQNVVFTSPTLLQDSIAKALEIEIMKEELEHNSYWTNLRSNLLEKRNKLASILRNANISYVMPQGGYFMIADLASLVKHNNLTSTQSEQKQSYLESARKLIESKNLVAIPASVFLSKSIDKDNNNTKEANLFLSDKELNFNMNSTFRLCFIKSNSTLDKLQELLSVTVK